jgi:hypothetical protein
MRDVQKNIQKTAIVPTGKNIGAERDSCGERVKS